MQKRNLNSPNRRRRLTVQPLESRQLLAADVPIGATPTDTGEFLLGTVTVTPVFFESDGSIDPNTQNWSAAEIDATLVKIRESVDWWTDLLATQTSVHSLEFVIDDTYARQPVATGYEPIDRSSSTFERYTGDWLTDLGYGDAPSIERAMHLFNDSQRVKHQTDWAFTMIVVDSSDDDGFFASGGFSGAFAYPGGLFYVVPSERPVSTYSHELGHLFWARDEYPGGGSWTDQRGYYNAQNLNAADNPTPGFVQEDSIMRGGTVATRAWNALESPESTLAMIGWRDSDNDGVFDVLDVPIELDAVGWFDPDTSMYSLRGSAAVATLANQNSAGNQSDITLSRVSELQYKLDDGNWQVALSPNAPQVDFDLQFQLDTAFEQIQWRAIDTANGAVSEILVSDQKTPVFSGVGGGYVYADANANGQHEWNERLLAGTPFVIRHSDGRELFRSQFNAADLPEGVIGSINGLTFTSLGDDTDGRAAVRETADGGVSVIHGYDSQYGEWNSNWGARQQLQVAGAESGGVVTVDFTGLDTGTYGLESGSYARMEAFDQQGNSLGRATSPLVLADQPGQLQIRDPLGRIASVKIYGHAETEIMVSAVAFGQSPETVTGPGGEFSLSGLADGSYTVELVSQELIYEFPTTPIPFQISGGSVGSLGFAASRIDSPRYNATLPGDVNGDLEVTPRDALTVVNDLGINGNRVLTAAETGGFYVDVNNDGMVSPLDALRVINLLQRRATGESEQPLHLTDSAHPTQSDWIANPLHQAAVDQVFLQNTPHLEPNGYQTPNRADSKMLNSAGADGSGQSLGGQQPDRTAWADILPTSRTESASDADGFTSEFLPKLSKIRREFAENDSSVELF
ncbi:dockerin type I domain-containing protein [Stieleria sp. TO1_6]|uniref:dockerin type I domain-containing protein n=1 Tax=Stieleria tagensis TaxID=2956795 RepID=UPI00209BB647|nr:dockerin type I domain-containing protein [Stieleria tagensis]MCO8123947.1 dockerin type I domain-containing protein [Stieleria tagensis]